MEKLWGVAATGTYAKILRSVVPSDDEETKGLREGVREVDRKDDFFMGLSFFTRTGQPA